MMKVNANELLLKAGFQVTGLMGRATSYTKSGELTHRKAFIAGAMIALSSVAMAGPPAPPAGGGAAGNTAPEVQGDPLTRASAVICQVSDLLRGPIGVGIIIVCIVLAGLSLAFGGKNSTSLLISALLGAIVVFGARTLIGFIVTGSGTVACK